MDQRVRVMLRAAIRHIHNQLKLTTIYVTHDQEEAIALADRIIVMNEGVIQQVGPLDELWNHPVNQFVGGFLGEPAMNFVKGTIENPRTIAIITKDGKFILEINREIDNKHVGSEVTVGIRPAKIIPHLNKKDGAIPSLLEVIEPLGESKILTVKIDKTELKVVTFRDMKADPGQVIWLEFDLEDIHVFHRETGNALITGVR
jgi:multiple sugar transport system ATP-binding protein